MKRGEKKRVKKGLSTIVITLIIILISLVAISVIWIAVRNVISRGSEEISLSGTTLNAGVEVIGTNETRNNVSLIITRKTGQGEFTGIVFLFENATSEETVEKHFTIYELESKGFELHLENLGVANLTKLSIYTLYRSSSNEFTLGAKTDEYIFSGVEKFLFKPGGGAICGNNLRELWEECDGIDWGGVNDCSDIGFISGTVTCNPPGDMRECMFDTSQCVSPIPQCSDGVDNDGNGCADYSSGDTGCSSASDTTESGGSCPSGCTPATCASLGYECGTGYLNGSCSGTLNCNNPGCGSRASCSSGTCVCNLGWGDCNNDNTCECDLSANSCSGGTCVSGGGGRDNTPRTCSGVWGFDCGAVCGTEADNTYDSCLNCNNTDERIDEVWINATSVIGLEQISTICQYFTSETTADELYVYYRNSSSGTWQQKCSGNTGGTGSTIRNWTACNFAVDNIVGVHQARCIIHYTGAGTSCATGDWFDNDDINFTVSSLGTPPPQCSDGIDNDGNGCADFSSGDTGCSSASDTTESGGTCPDVTPPVLSNGAPTGTLASGTTQANVSFLTNENANCRYSTTPGVAYSSMTNTFTGTLLSHSKIMTGLTDGNTYTYYVRCSDTIGNANTADYPISFSVATSGGGDLIPLNRIADWSRSNIGVPGGIPTNWPNCVTTQCNTVWGGSVTSATLSSAISSAPANTVIRIPAGTYTLNSVVEISRDNITVRGAGMGVTTLNAPGVTAIRSQQWGAIGSGTLTSGYTKGSNSVVVSGNIPVVGDLIEMYQNDDPSLVWTRTGVNDLTFRHTAYVTGVAGSTVTFSPAITYSFSASFNPRYKYTHNTEAYIGIENLTISQDANAPEAIYFYEDYAVWVKNVEIKNFGDTAIKISRVVNGEVRGCNIHDTLEPTEGYGVYIMSDYGDVGTSTATLIEDNVFNRMRTGVLFKGSVYNVVAYNYIGDTSPTFGWYLEAGINTNHGAHGIMNLIEGNTAIYLQNDGYHGSTSHTTIYRNWFYGTCDGYCMYPGNKKTIDLDRFSWYENVYGNVLGDTSWNAAEYQMTGNTWDYTHYVIYRLGYPNMGNNWYNPANPPNNPANQDDAGLDPNVAATILRHGNYDYFNNAVLWDPANSNHNLPASIYLPAKPSWWCQETPWPPIGPDVAGLHNTIPAQRRFLGQACTP